MRYGIILLIAISFFIISCSDDDNPTETNSEELKEEAIEFSLQIINCYFTQDAVTYKNSLPEILYQIDPEEPPFETEHFIVSNVLSSTDYSSYTLDQYKETYDYKIWEHEDYSVDSEQWLSQLTYWSPTEDDYLFLGHNTLEGKEGFMDYKPLIFFVTKASGSWKLKATY